MLIFAALKSLLPSVRSVVIDNWVFRLHCKVSVVFLVGSFILATSREYIGEPIACYHSTDNPPTYVINNYCWIQATFSVPSKLYDEFATYPGIGNSRGDPSDQKYHKYYQWVGFMLCLQALLFYLPRYFWKLWEGGMTNGLLQDLDLPIVEPDDKKRKIELLTGYFIENLHAHNSYAIKYYICEALNLVNVIGQIFLVDKFLDHQFISYGLRVFSYLQKDQDYLLDPMVEVFPRVTKCKFSSYGVGGDREPKDIMCILPLNIINEKIYVFMWIWFVVLTAITCILFLYRIVLLAFRSVRVVVLHMRCRMLPIRKIASICSRLQIGDWFILCQLGKNMDPSTFKEFMLQLEGNFEAETANREISSTEMKNNKTYGLSQAFL